MDSGVSTSKITIDLTGEHLCLKVVEGNNIELQINIVHMSKCQVNHAVLLSDYQYFCFMHITNIFHSAYYWKHFFFCLFTLVYQVTANSQTSAQCSIVYYDLILQMNKTKQICTIWLLRKQLHNGFLSVEMCRSSKF